MQVGFVVALLGIAFAEVVSAQSGPKKTDIYAIAVMEAAKRTGEKVVVVDKDGAVAATYPDHVDEIRLEVLGADQLVARSKALKKSFDVLGALPAQADGALLRVRVMQDSFSGSSGLRVWWRHGLFIAKRRGLRYEISSWFDVYFAVDPETQEYRVVNVKLGGI